MEDPQPEPTCPACGAHYGQAYCGDCGEALVPSRPTFGGLLQGTLGGLASTDHALGRTLTGMLVDPSGFAGRWLRGDRRRHLSPVRTLVWGLAFFFLVHKLLGQNVMEATGIEISTDSSDAAALGAAVRSQVERWLQPLMLLTLPILALVHRWLYRGSGRSYVDCLVLIAFVEGFLYFARGLTGPLAEVSPGAHRLLRFALVAVWSVRSAQGFFSVSWGRALALELVARVLHAILAMAVIAAVTIPLALRALDS